MSKSTNQHTCIDSGTDDAVMQGKFGNARFAPRITPVLGAQKFISRGASWLVALLVVVLIVAFGQTSALAQSEPLKIGIIGTGKIGGALARHWARAGHELVISSRHPEKLEPLAAELGPRVRSATPAEAAAALAGKIVLDTGNPFLGRDGDMAIAAREKGAGIASAEFLPGARLVRAFNCIPAFSLANSANRMPERIAIPIASDYPEALKVAPDRRRGLRRGRGRPVDSLAQFRSRQRTGQGKPRRHGAAATRRRTLVKPAPL